MIKRIAIFASGRGSNAEALVMAMRAGEIHGTPVVILSDQAGALVLEKAQQWKIPTLLVERSDYKTKESFEEAMLDALKPYMPDTIVLAGYMRLLGKTFISAYEGRILNIHPALLPSFTGLHAQRQAVEAGVKVSGCTVHFVDTGMDSGPIIMQTAVPVYADDTEYSLAERILPKEHVTYKKALALYCDNKLHVNGHIVSIDE